MPGDWAADCAYPDGDMIEVVDMAPCPHCGGGPEFIERDLPTGTHASCKFVCTNAECPTSMPGIARVPQSAG